MKKRAAMKAFNILASIGIIATLFLGFYLFVGTQQTQEVKKITADIGHLDSSSQLLTILRTPIGEKTLADELAEGRNDEFISKIKKVFGEDTNYKITVDGRSSSSKKEPARIIAELNTELPKYPSGTAKLSVEVGE